MLTMPFLFILLLHFKSGPAFLLKYYLEEENLSGQFNVIMEHDVIM